MVATAKPAHFVTRLIGALWPEGLETSWQRWMLSGKKGHKPPGLHPSSHASPEGSP
jgi:hypothetical protein